MKNFILILTLILIGVIAGTMIGMVIGGVAASKSSDCPTENELKVQELKLKQQELRQNICFNICNPMNLPYERYEQAKDDYEECVWRCVK